MAKATTEIRENARKDLEKWFTAALKEDVRTYYRFFRTMGRPMPAALCLAMAKKQVEIEMNEFGRHMFHSHIPEG